MSAPEWDRQTQLTVELQSHEGQGLHHHRQAYSDMKVTTALTNREGTNSALGIGRASAHQFAQNGAKAIYLCDFADNLLETHKREINSLYPNVEIHTRSFDASDEESVKKVVGEAVSTYGRLDVFFANAGIASGKIFTEVTPDEFMRMMKVNTMR